MDSVKRVRSLFGITDTSEMSSLDGKLAISCAQTVRVFMCCTRLQNRIFDAERLISIGIDIF